MRCKTDLTDQHIADIIRELRSDVHLVEKLWGSCIPVSEYNIELKIGFIVASLPAAAECSPQFVAMQLRIGPEFMSDWHNEVKPEIVHVWSEEYPKTFEEVKTVYRKHALVPDHVKESGEWCCLCALREALGRIAETGGDCACMASSVETIQSAMAGWLHENQEG